MTNPAKRYTIMPIPVVEEHTRYFEADPIAIGVEYRLLNKAIVTRHVESQEAALEVDDDINDRGVSVHVFATHEDGERLERLRFDCFDEDPHYHYVDWKEGSNDIVHLDAIANGDSLTWALERIRTRLPQMLERAGAGDVARRVDTTALDAILPRVAEAAYRARYEHDDKATLRAALTAR
ncbi:MAG: DUF7700 domain-containing protein [Gammaproteobacteria bacterium]